MAKQSENKFIKALKKLIKKGHYATFDIGSDENDSVSGFALSLSDDFLLIQLGDNFRLDGYMILSLNFIRGVVRWDSEKVYEEILREEDIRTDSGPVEKINLSSWRKVFKSLKKRDFHAIVEGWNKESDFFFIGPIEKITDKSVHLRNYDSTGTFDPKTVRIKFKHIEQVTFGDRYSTIFRKYLKEKP